MVRVEPHGVGSVVHVIKRGTRGMDIVRDIADREHFAQSLFYLNDKYKNENWKRDIASLVTFARPDNWPEREPLVDVLAWTLLSNHFHLLLQERVEKGIARFMQRLGNSMTSSFNKKYHEQGSLFQGSYKGKTVDDNLYLQQLVWYVLVKNVLELYPGGLRVASKEFNKAWDWGLNYRFSSFGATVTGKQSSIINDKEQLIAEICQAPNFKKEVKELIALRAFQSDELKSLALEDWN